MLRVLPLDAGRLQSRRPRLPTEAVNVRLESETHIGPGSAPRRSRLYKTWDKYRICDKSVY